MRRHPGRHRSAGARRAAVPAPSSDGLGDRGAARRPPRSRRADHAEPLRRGVDVLVPATGQVDQDHPVGPELAAQPQRARDRVRRLDRRDDALGAAEQRERVHRLGVGDRPVLGAAEVLEQRVLRPDAGVVQPRGDRVRLGGLAVVVLQQVGHRPVQRAGRAGGQGGAVPAGLDAVAAGLEADQPRRPGRRGRRGRSRSRWTRRRRTPRRRRAAARPGRAPARAPPGR